MTAISIRGVTIFYGYAAEDLKYLQELEKHLSSLKRLGKVTTWYDRRISAGTDWEQDIDAHLNAADIIVLFISPDFIQSDYCYNVEMRRALERHQDEQTEVIPIIVRPVRWKDTPLSKFQALPTKGKAITLWDNRGVAYKDVTDGISKVVSSLLALQWWSEGKMYYMTASYSQALQAYNETLALNPQHAEIHRDKGHVLLKLNYDEEALQAYTEAIYLRPNEARFYIQKGLALYKLNRYSEALVAYEQALQIDHTDPFYHIHKGNVFLQLQRPDDALQTFEQALQLKPDSSAAYYGQGCALDMLGKANEAQQAFQKAYSLGWTGRHAIHTNTESRSNIL